MPLLAKSWVLRTSSMLITPVIVIILAYGYPFSWTATGRKMVAWKMSTVIVAGKGINRARSTNHDRTEITNSNQPYFWGGVFSTHEIWEEKIWERLFWSTLIFIRVEKFLAGWTNRGNKVCNYILDGLSYALIKTTHVMSESKFHAESYSILVFFINVTNHCNIKYLWWHLSSEVWFI